MTRRKTEPKPIVTAVRLCATCGDPFTWTSANPRRRFCTPVCKARWWRRSHDRASAAAPPVPGSTNGDGTVPAANARTVDTTSPDTARTANAVTDQYATSNDQAAHTSGQDEARGDVRTANAVTATDDPYGTTSYDGGYGTPGKTPGALQNCPHCHQQVAIINLLVPPVAAFVNTPTQSVTDTHQNHNLISL